MHKQIEQLRDRGISLLVVCAQGQNANKPPAMKNELEMPIRKHNSSATEKKRGWKSEKGVSENLVY